MAAASPKHRASSGEKEAPVEVDLLKLGRMLEAAREAAGLSAREVASKVDISPTYLGILERGLNPKTRQPSTPRTKVLLGLAHILDLDPAELFPLAGLTYTAAQADQALAANAARGAISEALQTIHEALGRIGDRGPFIADEMKYVTRELAAELGRLSRGVKRCSPEEEPRLAKLAVRQCREHLRAVSYRDLLWWGGPEGATYLDDHKERLDDGVTISRVFLYEDNEDLSRFQEAFARHRSIGIVETYVVPLSQVPHVLHSDFVVYDDSLMRRAHSDDFEDLAGGVGKIAEFSDDPSDVDQAINEFREVLAIAQSDPAYRVDAVLRRLEERS